VADESDAQRSFSNILPSPFDGGGLALWSRLLYSAGWGWTKQTEFPLPFVPSLQSLRLETEGRGR